MSMGFRDGIRILYTYTGLKQCTVIPGHTYVVKCKNFLILTGKPFFIEFHSFSGLHFFVTNAGISVIDACRTYLHMYLQCRYILQGFGSGSGLDPYSIGPVDPDPYSESGSGSRRAKMTHKRRKNSCFEVLDGLFCELQASSVTWTYFMEA
jgi:hypothetical protein